MADIEPLRTRWPVHGEDEIAAVADVLRGGPPDCAPASGLTNYWTGREGEAFETEWARSLGLPHALAVSNGTTALECCLRGVGLPEVRLGHDWMMEPQVIVPARTFIATASAVVQCGGRPVLADIDPGTLCVTAETLEAARTGATVGVIVVHYGGLPVPDMDAITRWAMKHGLWIVEDCAHAHGAPGVGTRSHAAAWSFCVGKIMSTGGEGGMVACLDDGVAGRMRAYRDHGRYNMVGSREARDLAAFSYTVEEFGSNARMTEMQAVIGRIQLRGLAANVARRQEIAAAYDACVESRGLQAMFTPEQRRAHARYLYHCRVDAGRRDDVMARLVARGIPARVGGCPSLRLEPCFVKRGWAYDTPMADQVGRETFSLPVYPTMGVVDVARVCDALREVL